MTESHSRVTRLAQVLWLPQTHVCVASTLCFHGCRGCGYNASWASRCSPRLSESHSRPPDTAGDGRYQIRRDTDTPGQDWPVVERVSNWGSLVEGSRPRVMVVIQSGPASPQILASGAGFKADSAQHATLWDWARRRARLLSWTSFCIYLTTNSPYSLARAALFVHVVWAARNA